MKEEVWEKSEMKRRWNKERKTERKGNRRKQQGRRRGTYKK